MACCTHKARPSSRFPPLVALLETDFFISCAHCHLSLGNHTLASISVAGRPAGCCLTCCWLLVERLGSNGGRKEGSSWTVPSKFTFCHRRVGTAWTLFLGAWRETRDSRFPTASAIRTCTLFRTRCVRSINSARSLRLDFGFPVCVDSMTLNSFCAAILSPFDVVIYFWPDTSFFVRCDAANPSVGHPLLVYLFPKL